MSFRPCSIAPAIAAVVMILLVVPASARAAQGGLDDWRVLHKFERHALNDYIRHKSTSDVAQRGQLLMTMARSPAFSALGANCRRAAETLSYMVSGYYWSAQRLEVALDWHHYEEPYLEQRAACLKDLGVDERAFPLPYWFTRR